MNIKRFLFLFLLAVVLAVGFSGCAGKSDLVKDINANLAELRLDAYKYEAGGVKVEIISGQREEPYSPDGSAGNLVPFTVITFTPAGGALGDYSYTLRCGENEYEGMLDPHPFGALYIQDIGAMVEGNLVFTAKDLNGKEISCELTPLRTDGMLDHNDAIQSFVNACSDDIKKLYKGRKLSAEAYVRFLSDPLSDSGVFYWYCAVSSPKQTYAVLIDTLSGEIISRR